MILKESGQSMEFGGVQFTVGMRVKSNDTSCYANLYGTVTEIRTDDDRNTDNDTPDIYCRFDPPVTPKDIEALETHFTKLCGQPKAVKDLGLDRVIMAPDKLISLAMPAADRVEIPLYIVIEDWTVDGNAGYNERFFFSMEEARLCFHDLLVDEKDDGCISRWQDNDSFSVETGADLYEVWLDGEYCENHYKLNIETKKAVGSKSLLRKHLDSAKECSHAAY